MLVNSSKIENNNSNDNLLEPSVINLLNIISSEDIINKFLDNMQIDNERMQISKINKKRISRAEEILFQLQNEVKENNLTNCDVLSQEYNRYIPYNKYKILDNSDIINQHIEKIEVIKNMFETYETIIKNKKKKQEQNDNPTSCETNYIYILVSLNTNITFLQENSPRYLELSTNIQTKLRTKYKNLKIFEVYNEEKYYNYLSHTENIADKRLLYHGSPITNWFSIIKNGLYINPKKIGVNINGKAYGNGVYFSDDVNLSFGYSVMKNDNNNILILGMFEVALCQKSYAKSPVFVLFDTKQCYLRYLLLITI